MIKKYIWKIGSILAVGSVIGATAIGATYSVKNNNNNSVSIIQKHKSDYYSESKHAHQQVLKDIVDIITEHRVFFMAKDKLKEFEGTKYDFIYNGFKTLDNLKDTFNDMMPGKWNETLKFSITYGDVITGFYNNKWGGLLSLASLFGISDVPELSAEFSKLLRFGSRSLSEPELILLSDYFKKILENPHIKSFLPNEYKDINLISIEDWLRDLDENMEYKKADEIRQLSEDAKEMKLQREGDFRNSYMKWFDNGDGSAWSSHPDGFSPAYSTNH